MHMTPSGTSYHIRVITQPDLVYDVERLAGASAELIARIPNREIVCAWENSTGYRCPTRGRRRALFDATKSGAGIAFYNERGKIRSLLDGVEDDPVLILFDAEWLARLARL